MTALGLRGAVGRKIEDGVTQLGSRPQRLDHFEIPLCLMGIAYGFGKGNWVS